MGNDANGYLLPSWYVPEQPTMMDLNIVSIIWGFTLATTVFTFSKAIQQSWKSYKRGKLFNAYIIMVWAEWLVCVIISIVSWLFLTPSLSILPGFWLYFGLCEYLSCQSIRDPIPQNLTFLTELSLKYASGSCKYNVSSKSSSTGSGS